MGVTSNTYRNSGSFFVPSNVKQVEYIAVGGGGGGGPPMETKIVNGVSVTTVLYGNGQSGGTTTVSGVISASGGRGGTAFSGGSGGSGNYASGSTGQRGQGCYFPEASAGYGSFGKGGAGATACSSGSNPNAYGGGGGGASRAVVQAGSNGASPGQRVSYSIGAGGVQGGVGANRYGDPGAVYITVTTWELPSGTLSARNPDDPTSSWTTGTVTIVRGGRAQLRWSSTETSYVNISNLGNNLPTADNRQVVRPSSTTDYTLFVFNPGYPSGRQMNTVRIRVIDPPTFNLTSNRTSIIRGESATLTWSTTGTASSVVWTSGGISNTGLNSSAVVFPSQTTTYSGYAVGAQGAPNSPPDSETITVYQIPTASISAPGSINYNSSLQVTCSTTNAINGVTLTGQFTYNTGDGGYTTNMNPISLSNGTNTPTIQIPWNSDGPVSISLVLTANGGGGVANTATASTAVNVIVPPPTINSFYTNPSTIIRGSSAQLIWNVSGVGISSIRGVTLTPSIGNQAKTGSLNVSPSSTTLYGIQATGYGGTSTKFYTLNVYEPPNVTLSLDRNPIVRGESTRLTWSTTGDASSAFLTPIIGPTNINSNTTVNPTTDTTYRISVEGLGGNDSDEITLIVYQPPTASLTGPTSIPYNSQATLQYSATNAVTSVTLTPQYSYRERTVNGSPINLPTGVNLSDVYTTGIPYADDGPFLVSYTLAVVGYGGLNISKQIIIPIDIDETPDNIIIPSSDDKLKDEEPIYTPDEAITSYQIQINDIDIPVEILATRPIQVRRGHDDNWNDIREYEDIRPL